jgi:hypothetical protein
MNEELHKKLIEDLGKSGFGSEMQAIKIFIDKGWRCSGGYYYFDEDEGKNKETDLVAGKGIHEKLDNGMDIDINYHIVAEVKKSEKPWVVFKKSFVHEKLESTDAWNNLIYQHNLPWERYNIVAALSENSLLKILKWKGYSIHESFKKPDAPSRWYSAFISVCKAAESELATHSTYTKIREWYGLLLVKPIVILDGTLVSASLTDDGDVLLEEIKFAPFEFFHKSKNSTKDRYRVDVVKLDYLAEYIELSDARLKSISSRLLSLM